MSNVRLQLAQLNMILATTQMTSRRAQSNLTGKGFHIVWSPLCRVCSPIHLLTTQCCLHRWLIQARKEFTQGAQEHLMVTGVDCDDLVQEGLQALDQEMQAWVEQLRQNKVCLQTFKEQKRLCCHKVPMITRTFPSDLQSRGHAVLS